MTNFEKYETNISDICDTGDDIAIVNGIPVGCNTLYDCTECDFDGINETCNYQLLKWATAEFEYKEPAPKLTKREREFIETFWVTDKAIKRDRLLYLCCKTYKGEFQFSIKEKLFPFIKQGETWTFEDLLKLEVEE